MALMTDTPDNRRPQFAAEDYERGSDQVDLFASDYESLDLDAIASKECRKWSAMLRAAADLARECERLRELVEKVWRQTGGREYHNTDDELPGIVYTAFVGCERLRKHAEAAESRESELREKVRVLRAEMRWIEVSISENTWQDALHHIADIKLVAKKALAATADEPKVKE